MGSVQGDKVRHKVGTAKRDALIILPAVCGEAIQHIVEYWLGMYVLGDGISPGFETNCRNLAIVFKVIGFLSTVALERQRKGSVTRPSYNLILIAMLIGAHYALNFGAVGQSREFVLTLISADCLIIGWLAKSVGAVLVPKPDG